MRFLLEKSLISREQEIEFDTLPEDKKLEYVNNFVRELPNYSKISSSLGTIVSSISEHGFDTNKNKFLDYITNVDWKLGSSTSSIVNQLLNNGKLDLDVNEWIFNPDLYKGSSEDVDYRLKAFAYASNKDIQKGVSEPLTTDMLLNADGTIKDTESIRNLLKSITVDKDDKGKNVTGISLLTDKLNVVDKLGFNSVSQYLKSLYIGTSNESDVHNFLNTPKGKELIRTILSSNYTDNDMYDDLEPIDMLNDAFRVKIDDVLEKSEDKANKSNKDRTGADILRAELDNYNYSDIVKYVLSITDGRYKNRIDRYLNSAEGKDALDTLLNKKSYFDSSLGDDVTPLDKLNNAIKVMINKEVVQPADKDRTTKATKAKKRRAQQKKEAEKKLNPIQQSAVEVLKGAKLSEKTAVALVKELYKPEMSVEDLVLSAFKSLGK